jgi:hypothetical protein
MTINTATELDLTIEKLKTIVAPVFPTSPGIVLGGLVP